MKKKEFYIHKMNNDPDFVVNSTFLMMIKDQKELRDKNYKE